MNDNNKGPDVTDFITTSTILNLGLGAAVSYLGWNMRQDKLKVKETAQAIVLLQINQARQDERQKALVTDVGQIKDDTKEIKRILMERN